MQFPGQRAAYTPLPLFCLSVVIFLVFFFFFSIHQLHLVIPSKKPLFQTSQEPYVEEISSLQGSRGIFFSLESSRQLADEGSNKQIKALIP